ncbi:MAG: hypothetical protein QG564_416 [Campylobacterota bacterium]|nr:hypothetical protein [Campylobacterota bacterium]
MEQSLKIVKLLLALTAGLWAFEHKYTIENTNFTLLATPYPTEEKHFYNYNRLRLDHTLKEENWYINLIGDINNYYGKHYLESNEYLFFRTLKADTPFDIETDTHNYGEGELFGRIHRFNIGYSDERQHLVFGLQKITMGVGRIWTPTDLFNPRNPLALEPDQIYGAYALSYSYAPNQTTEIMGVISQRSNNSYKYASRAKTHILTADIALDLLNSDDAQMIAYELEGDFFDTGIEWRSEGGYFKDKTLSKTFYQGILGIDYGFKNGATAILEWLHSSKTYTALEIQETQNSTLANNRFASSDYLGSSLSYDFTLMLQGSIGMIFNLEDHSLFSSPLLTYSIDDETTLSLGAMLYGGSSTSEFGEFDHRYYLRLKKTF